MMMTKMTSRQLPVVTMPVTMTMTVALVLLALLAPVTGASALTFKKDGSVIQKDGKVVQPSDAPASTGSAPTAAPATTTAPARAMAAGRIPDWCASPPENTIFRVSACGTASSTSLSMAKNRALLDAKRQLADVVNGAIEFANNSIVSSANEVPIRGYRRISEETMTIKGRLHHFVLLQMEIGPAADLMTKSLEYSIDRFKSICPDGWTTVDGGCVIY
ncbi:hypothetical protein AB3X55_08185 [Alphaproteobacteria bacterium LSUCC0719]